MQQQARQRRIRVVLLAWLDQESHRHSLGLAFDFLLAQWGKGKVIFCRNTYRLADKDLAPPRQSSQPSGQVHVIANYSIRTTNVRSHVANNPTGFARNFGNLLLGLETQDEFV